MTRLVSELITSARKTLNDKDATGYRNSDPEMIAFAIDGLQTMRNMRPDLFVGRFTTAIGTLTALSAIPVDDQFFRPLVDFVIARCEMTDDEHVVSARAELEAKMFVGYL